MKVKRNRRAKEALRLGLWDGLDVGHLSRNDA